MSENVVKIENVSKRKILSLESLIGGGKTTFLNMIKERYNDRFVVLPEPIDMWTDCNGENILELFYKDTEKYAYMFQTRCFVTRARQLEEYIKKNPDDNRILERKKGQIHTQP